MTLLLKILSAVVVGTFLGLSLAYIQYQTSRR